MAYGISRRQALAQLGAVGLAADAASASARIYPKVFRGHVLEWDGRSHRPLPQVMVSNGRDVVLSRADGSWALTAHADDDIFVIKPPHLRIVGRSASSPILFVDAGASDGMSETTFVLERVTEPDRFDVLLLTDTQPESHEELDFVRDDILAAVLTQPAAFAIHHGDVVSDALHLYPRYQQLLQATGLVWHHCVGNHDIDREAGDNVASRATWRRTFGPRWYAFQHAHAVFFILDNVEYLGHADGRYRGRLGREQLGFVARVLAHVPHDRLVVLSMHIPLRSYLAPDDPADNTSDFEELLHLLGDRPQCVSFSGHLHATEHHYLRAAAPVADQPHHHHVLTAGSGSWWSGPRDSRGIPCADSTDGSPNGFHVLRIDGRQYQTDFVPSAGKAPTRFRAELHRDAGKSGQGMVILNVFDGGPRTLVECRVGAQGWMPMEQRALRDPMVCRMLAGPAPRKSWVEPTPSSHIWTANFAGDLPPGPTVLEIRLRDEYGRPHAARGIVEPQAR